MAKLKASCSVCADPRHAQIDAAIRAGGSRRAIARRFELAVATLGRHQAHASPAAASSTTTKTKAPPGKRLPAHAGGVRAGLLERIQDNIEALDRDTSLPATDRARALAALAGAAVKLGRAAPAELTEADVVAAPAFQRVLDEMKRILGRHPVALAELVAAFESRPLDEVLAPGFQPAPPRKGT